MIQAVILAGGLGTRLRQVLGDIPKPMAPVRGKPFLEYQLEALKESLIDKLVLCVGYRAQVIMDYFGDGSKWGVEIEYSQEQSPLGTAGALRNARSLLEEEFFVLNADTFVKCDYASLLSYHRERTSEATLAIRAVDERLSIGNVIIDTNHRITFFGEDPVTSGGLQVAWVNAGIYVMTRAVIGHIPAGRPVSLERETFPLILALRLPMFGFVVSGYFVDIGTPGNYQKFERELFEGRVNVDQE
jgi:mannose-1-phosphate guanylyltransferase